MNISPIIVKMKRILGALFCLFIMQSVAQPREISKAQLLNKFGFQEHTLLYQTDTVYFYIHKKSKDAPKHLVLYLQGTAPDPLFSIEREEGKTNAYRWFPSDYKILDDTYAYAVLAKTGIAPVYRTGDDKDVAKYQRSNSLHNRVSRADTVINYIANRLFPNLENVVVYGHSEGAPVAAKLTTVNKRITHLGFWAGNALPDFYDFMLFNTKAVDAKKLKREEAFKQVESLLVEFSEIASDSAATSYEDEHSYTNKRWWSYAEPPINNLLKIDIPIFMQVAGNDENAPVESTFLVPLEFMRLGKTNLTYRICANCDHGFAETLESGEERDRWRAVFEDFIKWVESN